MTIETINPILFHWDDLTAEQYEGETGSATIKAQSVGSIQIRQVTYSKNYLADHWCDKGHIVFVISGQLEIEHKDGKLFTLESGTTYVVGDNTMAHKARSDEGAVVLIVD